MNLNSGSARAWVPRASLGVLAIAVLLSAFCWYLGLSAWQAISLGGVVTGLGVLAIRTPRSDAPFDRWAEAAGNYRRGSRSDIAELADALRWHRGRVGHAAFWRVQRLAGRRLEARGLKLDDPTDRRAIQALIGRGAYHTLLAPGRARLPSRGAVLRSLTALDRLDPRRAGTRQQPAAGATVSLPHLRRTRGR